jgi:hypothetical protein
MARLSAYLVILSFIVLLISFWHRNDFPEKIAFEEGLETEPLQSLVEEAPFTLSHNKVNYLIDPQYDYTLHGLVVSYRHHDGDSMLHKSWNDHLNMMDVCVIWGKTAKSAYLNQLKFWNGQFTCNFKTKSSPAWASFNVNEISNNHLITNDEWIRDKVKDLKVGDQIRIKGWLSSYGVAKNGKLIGGKRGTSTVRDDTGNGACETIYVQTIDILKSMDNGWRAAMTISLIAFIFFLAIYFLLPYKVIN